MVGTMLGGGSLISYLRLKNFLHSQAIGTQKHCVRALVLVPTSHLVKLSLPNISILWYPDAQRIRGFSWESLVCATSPLDRPSFSRFYILFRGAKLVKYRLDVATWEIVDPLFPSNCNWWLIRITLLLAQLVSAYSLIWGANEIWGQSLGTFMISRPLTRQWLVEI